MQAIQLLHHDYTGRAERIVESQAAHADRNNVHYCIGQVCWHASLSSWAHAPATGACVFTVCVQSPQNLSCAHALSVIEGTRVRTIRAVFSHTKVCSFKHVQVFRHRTYGYRGVIYGWDRSCERDLNWTEKFNVDADQPFYWVLPDEVDCQRLFGGVRISKYVAQVQPLHTLNLISAHGFAQDETHGSISCACSEWCGYQGMERRYS